MEACVCLLTPLTLSAALECTPLGLHALTRPSSLLLPPSHPSISLLSSLLASLASRILLAACIAFGIVVVLRDVRQCLVGGQPVLAAPATNSTPCRSTNSSTAAATILIDCGSAVLQRLQQMRNEWLSFVRRSTTSSVNVRSLPAFAFV